MTATLPSQKISLSIIVPSYNEEKNLEATIVEVSKAIEHRIGDYEFIIVNDCSQDKTGEIADRLAATNPRVRAYHNEVNRGLGWNYRRGVELAKNEYVIMVPGDNEINPESIGQLLEYAGMADMIIPYPENIFYRPWIRQVVSVTFTCILNWISGYKLGYYNGSLLARRINLLESRSTTNGFAFQAETVVQLVRRGNSYKQVPFKLNYSSGRMTAFRLKNVIAVVATVIRMAAYYKLLNRGPAVRPQNEREEVLNQSRRIPLND
jgi:glycosyltransferase involved in cell wall biosynthesis